jgi:hypothetical protein
MVRTVPSWKSSAEFIANQNSRQVARQPRSVAIDPSCAAGPKKAQNRQKPQRTSSSMQAQNCRIVTGSNTATPSTAAPPSISPQ